MSILYFLMNKRNVLIIFLFLLIVINPCFGVIDAKASVSKLSAADIKAAELIEKSLGKTYASYKKEAKEVFKTHAGNELFPADYVEAFFKKALELEQAEKIKLFFSEKYSVLRVEKKDRFYPENNLVAAVNEIFNRYGYTDKGKSLASLIAAETDGQPSTVTINKKTGDYSLSEFQLNLLPHYEMWLEKASYTHEKVVPSYFLTFMIKNRYAIMEDLVAIKKEAGKPPYIDWTATHADSKRYPVFAAALKKYGLSPDKVK